MQQITLELDSDEDGRPSLTLEPEPEREQRLIALMAKVLVAVVQTHGGDDHERE
jgi:hypothetical protein